jgi:hypothetical protein
MMLVWIWFELATFTSAAYWFLIDGATTWAAIACILGTVGLVPLIGLEGAVYIIAGILEGLTDD